MSTAAIVGGSIAAAGIGAGGSIAASGAQSSAANNAANLQSQNQQSSLAEQQREFNINQQNMAPWLQAGTQGINALSSLLSTPGQGLLTPWTQQFNAPTAEEASQTPGYQFQLQQGEGAIQNSQAAQGGLIGGNAMTALNNYAQGTASANYQQVYNNALTQYQQAYNTFQGNQTNEFNRLASLSGAGQTAATTLGQQGQAAASNITNINATAGQQIGNSLMAAGGATASGYAGLANSLSGGIGNINQYMMLQNLLNGQGGGAQTNTIPGLGSMPGVMN
jgi:hypothetical protein